MALAANCGRILVDFAFHVQRLVFGRDPPANAAKPATQLYEA
jgi:hypothetical protein